MEGQTIKFEEELKLSVNGEEILVTKKDLEMLKTLKNMYIPTSIKYAPTQTINDILNILTGKEITQHGDNNSHFRCDYIPTATAFLSDTELEFESPQYMDWLRQQQKEFQREPSHHRQDARGSRSQQAYPKYIQTSMPFKEIRKSCFRCGRDNHLIKDCMARYHVNGNKLNNSQPRQNK